MTTHRYEDLASYLNISFKSGIVNTRYILTEMAKELGLKPEDAIYPLTTPEVTV